MAETVIAGRYHLERSLGKGGMGDVYLAKDKLLEGELVALKVINSKYATDPQFRKSFLRDIQATRKIIHPNVVQSFEVGEVDGRLYFVMEYIEAETLEELLENRGRLEVERVIRLVAEIAKGLAAIHDVGVIHGDLKSANILVTSIDTIKISDFGLSHAKACCLEPQQELIGSKAYLAPESWEGEFSSASDIYALGVIAYEAVTGLLPFGDEHGAEMRHRHANVVPRPVMEERDVPRWFSDLIDRMLAKLPIQRPPSAAAIQSEINEQISDESIDYCRALQIAMSVSDLVEEGREELWEISHFGVNKNITRIAAALQDPLPENNKSEKPKRAKK